MVVFQNDGVLDLHAITTFGASVKEGKNPIGQFGTGLKYAIAVILRHGCGVTITLGGTVYSFGTKVQAIRNQDFSLVCMYSGYEDSDRQSCGFTTELGKHWELWMAYRELACNCMDEAGKISKESYAIDGTEGRTVICVTGQAFEAVYADRQKYILEDAPHLTFEELLEVRMVSSKDIHYRNILVGQTQMPALMSYNILRAIDLTEDRTMKYVFMLDGWIVQACLKSTDKDFIRKIVTASTKTFEGNLSFNNSIDPSEEFKQVVMQEYRKNIAGVNLSAVEKVRSIEKASFRPAIMKITPVQDKTLQKAINFCKRHGWDVDQYPIHVVQALGSEILAVAMGEEIWLSERIFQLGGTKAVASTLIEEFLHINRGYMDESRQMQQYLFDKMVSLCEEQDGEPL